MKFSVTTFTTQNVILPEDLIPKLAEWGYDGVELWGGRAYQDGQPKWGLEGRSDQEIKRLKDLVVQHNLEVSAVSTYFKFTESDESYKKSLQNGRKYCEFARLFNAKVIRVVGEGVASANMTEDKWKVFIRALKDLASIGEEYDVTFGLELHMSTPHDTIITQLRCIWQADSPRIRALYQPTTMPRLEPETDHLWALDKLLPYIVHVHINSSICFNDDVLKTNAGGHIHMSQILEKLKRGGYSGYVSIEGVPAPVLENLQKEIVWLKQFS